MDFYLPLSNMFIEVKGQWRHQKFPNYWVLNKGWRKYKWASSCYAVELWDKTKIDQISKELGLRKKDLVCEFTNTSFFNQKHEINGITKTVTEWCVEYDVKPSTIKSRMHGNKIGLTEALSKRGRFRYFVIDGKKQTLAELAKSRGLKYMCLYSRLVKGLTIEEALSTPSQCSTSMVIKLYTCTT